MTPNEHLTRTLKLRPQRTRSWPFAGLIWGYQTVAFYGVLAVYGLVFIGWNIPANLLYWLLPRRLSAPFGQFMVMCGFRALLGLMRGLGLATFDLSCLDALRDAGGLIIAPNHPTLIDVLLVASRLPRVVCITKAALWDNPACGAAARLAGYIRNDGAHKLVRAAATAVKAGNQLLIFPEGTRTRTGPVGPFKGGFALMARQAGAPIQTVFLSASPPYLAKGWGLMRRPEFPIVYRARLGRRFTVDGAAQTSSGELHAYFVAELGGR